MNDDPRLFSILALLFGWSVMTGLFYVFHYTLKVDSWNAAGGAVLLGLACDVIFSVISLDLMSRRWE